MLHARIIRVVGALALACAHAFASQAHAATCTWLINGSASWGTPGSWSGCGTGNGSPAGTPGPADTAVIPASTPLAVVDLGAARTVSGLDLQAGRIAGNFNLTISTQLNWSGGTLEGISAAVDELLVQSTATTTLSGGLHTLRARRWNNQGAINWSAGDLRLEADAEIDNQAVLTATPAVGFLLKVESDGSPLARFHNNSGGGVLTMNGGGGLALAANVIFDNGGSVNAGFGTLRIESPGSDFGTHAIASTGILEFAPMSARNLTGSPAIAGLGILRKFGPGTLLVSGGYSHTGPVRIFDGLLDFSTPAASISFADVALQAPGAWGGSDDFVVNLLTWNGGDIVAPGSGPTLTVPSIGSASVNLDDAHPNAGMLGRSLVNQGAFTINTVDPVSFKIFGLGGGAAIDNQGNFDISATGAQDFFLSCAGPGSRVDNRSGASWRMQHTGSGQVEVVPCLDAFDNAGTLRVDAGIAHLRAPGVDSGLWDVNGSSRLWLADSSPTLRVLGSVATVAVDATARIELWGRLQADGASRVLPNFDTRPSGVLFGGAAITLTGDPKWMGRIEGTGPGQTVTVPAGSTIANDFVLGGDFTLASRRMIVDGQFNVILRQLRLDGSAQLDINGSMALTTNPAGQARIGCLTAPPCGNLNNFGSITASSNTMPSVIGEGITYGGVGSITSTSGRFAIQAPGSFFGTYTATGGNELEFSRSARLFGPTANLTAGSSFIFGDNSGTLPVNVVSACISAGSRVFIFDSGLQLDCASPTSFAELRMFRAFSRITGSSPIVVTGHFEWGAGDVLGADGTQTFELAAGATGSFTAPAGVSVNRVLWDRIFTNHGSITWSTHNDTELRDNAQFVNASDGTVLVNIGGSAPGFIPDWTAPFGSPQLLNQGLYHVLVAAEHYIGVPFANSGTVRISNGTTYLTTPGSDSGDYLMDGATGALRLQGATAVRTLAATGSITGIGGLALDAGAQLQLDGSLDIGILGPSGGATIFVDSAGTAQVGQLQLTGGGIVSGAAQIDVTGSLGWSAGSIIGTGGTPGPLRLLPGSSSSFFGVGPHLLSDRPLEIGGLLTLNSGEILVPASGGGLVNVLVGGELRFDAAAPPVGMRCDSPPCVALMQVDGLLRQQGSAVPDLQLFAPLPLAGTLEVGGGGLQVNEVIQSGGLTDVFSGAQLQTSALTLNGGELRGGGTILGDIFNVAGTVRPGSSPGSLTIVGDYTQGASGTLVMEIAGNAPGSSHDYLGIDATATLDGTLTVVDAGYTPTPPEALSLAFADLGASGSFATTNVPYPGYQISYTANEVSLAPVGGPPVVNSTADPGDGICDVTECTLREAIQQANLMPDLDFIQFAIPGPGPHVIQPLTPLPTITSEVVLDGYTQPGASFNTQLPGLGLGTNAVIQVELDGSVAGGDGLVLNGPSGGLVLVAGLATYGWNRAIVTQGAADSFAEIAGNFIGLRADGSIPALPQSVGVAVSGGSPLIGIYPLGGGPVAPFSTRGIPASFNVNLIGANTTGIAILSAPIGGEVLVGGNLIGTAPDGTGARPNQLGISATTAGNIPGIAIGGTFTDARNVISGNADDGITFNCTATADNCFDGAVVRGNFIGPAANGGALGNGGDGIVFSQMSGGGVLVGGTIAGAGNLIAHNVGAGIRATSFTGTARAAWVRNDIRNNGGLGIDLNGDGRTPNDGGDGDSGPNGLLNFPAFSAFSAPGGTSAIIDVTLDTPDIGGNYPARVDFYKAIEDEPGLWLGSTMCAQPDVTCTVNFSFPMGATLAAGDVVLGVVTDGFGKSSEASYYASTITITADTPDPSIIGTPYSVSVEVASSPFTPLGSLDVSDGVGGTCPVTLAEINPGLAGGSCMLPSAAPAGVRTLSASYLPESAPRRPFTDTTDTEAHTVDAGIIATTTTITSVAPASVVVGQPFIVSVEVDDGKGTANSGIVEVQLLSGGSGCNIDLALASSCSLAANSALNTAVRAYYLGDGFLLPSASSPQAVSVGRASTTVTITADTPDPSVGGEAIAVTVALAVNAPGAGTPGGEVLVTDGVASCVIALPALQCQLLPKTLGAITLEARYLGDANYNPSTDTEAHTIQAAGADLSIEKFNGLRVLPGGAPSSYTLLVSNAGPDGVVNARVTDLLPPQLSDASWTCEAGAGASCPAAGSGTVDALVSLAAGSTLTFTLTATAQAVPEQVVTNIATIEPPANASDPDSSNNQSSDSDATGLFGEGFEVERE